VTPTNWIPVARLRRTRGRHGEFLAEIYSNKPGRADSWKEVTLELPGRHLATSIEQLWFHDGVPVFKLAGIDSISAGEPWEGAELFVPPEQSLQLEEGEYKHTDLTGCRLLDHGKDVGTVTGLQEFGGPPLLVVRTTDGREVLIPFARAICHKIDVLGKVIEADLPEGLLDL
jgi:16S rRNA processing protein RimM